ncbi:MAG: GxxExxY protein [Pseudomonadota bacterium]|nr:GxxExxY protein [Pseudomonadota bacterium]
MQFDNLSNQVIGLAIEVHKNLGPGLLESVYEQCLSYELQLNNINHQCQVELPIIYKGHQLSQSYRIDLLIENQLIIELKAVKELQGIHKAQLLTYMKLKQAPTGLLINFNEAILKNGIKRFVL